MVCHTIDFNCWCIAVDIKFFRCESIYCITCKVCIVHTVSIMLILVEMDRYFMYITIMCPSTNRCLWSNRCLEILFVKIMLSNRNRCCSCLIIIVLFPCLIIVIAYFNYRLGLINRKCICLGNFRIITCKVCTFYLKGIVSIFCKCNISSMCYAVLISTPA